MRDEGLGDEGLGDEGLGDEGLGLMDWGACNVRGIFCFSPCLISPAE
jgi:hypothetical protein